MQIYWSTTIQFMSKDKFPKGSQECQPMWVWMFQTYKHSSASQQWREKRKKRKNRPKQCVRTMCTHLRLSLSPLCLPVSLFLPQSIRPRWRSGARKRKNRTVFTAISLLQMSALITLCRLFILCFSCAASIPPGNETFDTRTHTPPHCHRYSCATSPVVSKVHCLV